MKPISQVQNSFNPKIYDIVAPIFFQCSGDVEITTAAVWPRPLFRLQLQEISARQPSMS